MYVLLGIILLLVLISCCKLSTSSTNNDPDNDPSKSPNLSKHVHHITYSDQFSTVTRTLPLALTSQDWCSSSVRIIFCIILCTLLYIILYFILYIYISLYILFLIYYIGILNRHANSAIGINITSIRTKILNHFSPILILILPILPFYF